MHLVKSNADCILPNRKEECEMKRLCVLFLVVVLIFSLTACDDGLVKGSIVNQSTDTMAELDIMPQKLFEFAVAIVNLVDGVTAPKSFAAISADR